MDKREPEHEPLNIDMDSLEDAFHRSFEVGFKVSFGLFAMGAAAFVIKSVESGEFLNVMASVAAYMEVLMPTLTFMFMALTSITVVMMVGRRVEAWLKDERKKKKDEYTAYYDSMERLSEAGAVELGATVAVDEIAYYEQAPSASKVVSG